VYTFDVTVKIRPAIAGDIAALVRTIVSKKYHSVFENFTVLVFDPKVVVGLGKVCVIEVFETFSWIIGENYHLSLSLSHRLVSPGRVTKNGSQTRQCAQALFLYSARNRNEQIWQVR